jgi:hypothetical protein
MSLQPRRRPLNSADRFHPLHQQQNFTATSAEKAPKQLSGSIHVIENACAQVKTERLLTGGFAGSSPPGAYPSLHANASPLGSRARSGPSRFVACAQKP